ncbi:uncharacterized protein A4U43_C10F12040 [Asparagus officinalis]|uniref:ENTH domain-containing protein n=1 Tax=Asparagus officinalis TaxID=4686 RepID=A0A5P1E2N6_ASPOF|nr:putative clathrin assembly protein At1g03050 [Asparagus officinalis]ONK56719.1 uncharacterized protein A4U43_C10F12040 [Asparagus officinalis]
MRFRFILSYVDYHKSPSLPPTVLRFQQNLKQRAEGEKRTPLPCPLFSSPIPTKTMAPSKIQKAIGSVKDQTSIGLAKVSNTGSSISDLEVAIVKATRHDEYPAEERHIQQILSLTSYAHRYISQCVCFLSRRLSRTRSWTVALKTLILVHRLLWDGDAAYEQEIFFATRRGTRMLNLSEFRDTSRLDAWDFSAFVRTYGRYLDEMLEFRMHGKRGRGRSRSRSQEMHGETLVMDEEGREIEKAMMAVRKIPETQLKDMRTEKIFTWTHHLQQLLDRFLACRPTGSAKNNRIVTVALHPLLRESYQLYYDLQEAIDIFLDRFMELEIRDCVRIQEIFSRLSKQFDELDRFYSWCKSSGISRSSELPNIEKITQKKLDVMDEFLRDRSNLSKKPFKNLEQLTNEEDEARRRAEELARQSSVKALPEPEPELELKQEEVVAEEEEVSGPLAIVTVEEEVDFLNMRDDAVTVEDRGDDLALALFEGHTAPTTSAPVWEAFTDDTADWETALVQSASNLSGQKAVLGGGFDLLLLDGMYSQPPNRTMMGFWEGAGSASSVALPKATPMLALPAPPTASGGGEVTGGDPFTASLSVPAPSYVQMAEMERKQSFLWEEQAMWQQYAANGMQGQVSLQQTQHYGMYPGGGYYQSF